jgi:geranylgeranyl diphosphate synthase, type II
MSLSSMVRSGRMKDGDGHFAAYARTVKGPLDRRVRECIEGCHSNDDIVTYFLSGKRFRGITVMMLHDLLAADEQGEDMALDLGAAVEIAHSISLLLDDMVDGGLTRRGVPTAHMVIGSHRTMLEAVRTLSIPYLLAGPYGHECVTLFSQAHWAIVSGAITELSTVRDGGSDVHYLDLVDGKTGALFKLAARLGAMSAGMITNGVEESYGQQLGRVFQIADDIADIQENGPREGSERLLRGWIEGERSRRGGIDGDGKLSRPWQEDMYAMLNSETARTESLALQLIERYGLKADMDRYEAASAALLSAPSEMAWAMLATSNFDSVTQ